MSTLNIISLLLVENKTSAHTSVTLLSTSRILFVQNFLLGFERLICVERQVSSMSPIFMMRKYLQTLHQVNITDFFLQHIKSNATTT